MTYSVYMNDENYQKIVGDYFNTVDLIQEGLNKGIYDAKQIRELATKINGDLQGNIKSWNKAKLEELEQEQKDIKESYQKELGYTTDRAKEIEMKYKLMGEYELQDAVTDLDTDDLLEINLLRMELKNRNLHDQEQKAKQYIMQNELDRQHENDERYNDISKEIGVISTAGNQAVIKLGEFKHLDSVQRELDNIIHEATVNPKQPSKDLGQILRDQKALENKAKSIG